MKTKILKSYYIAFSTLLNIKKLLKKHSTLEVIELFTSKKYIKNDYLISNIGFERIIKIIDNVCVIYTKKADCLQRTLILYKFIRKDTNFYNGDCKIIVGVNKYPFRSHAWLEIDNKVANDYEEFVSKYKPIIIREE